LAYSAWRDYTGLASLDAMKLALVDTTVREIVEAAVSSASPQIRERAQSLAVRVENPHARVVVDEARLTQALGNLLDNAAKYTDPGGIVLTATSHDDSLEIALRTRGGA